MQANTGPDWVSQYRRWMTIPVVRFELSIKGKVVVKMADHECT